MKRLMELFKVVIKVFKGLLFSVTISKMMNIAVYTLLETLLRASLTAVLFQR